MMGRFGGQLANFPLLIDVFIDLEKKQTPESIISDN